MTEPDEALIWARRQNGDPAKPRTITASYRAGLMAHGYRAGQAASAERIKALEEAIREAMRRLNEYADMTVDEWDDSVADGGIMAWMVIRQELETVVVYRLDRALLDEADR
jgi:hypothetical protein